MMHALLAAPTALFVAAVVGQHALSSPVFPAGDTAARQDSPALPVRFAEGMVHGFLELRTDGGSLLAHGDLLQVPGDSGVESRLVFHFPDSSVFTETVRFTQRGVFALQHYHLVQRGPAFATDLEVTLTRSGRYDVTARHRDDGEIKRYTGTLDLPPDVYNGMVILIAKNLPAQHAATVHIVAFTPKPRLIKLEIAPTDSQRVILGRHSETAVHYTLKPKLGPVVRAVAGLTGQLPPDSHVWIVTDGVPAFVRFEGPLYSGPVWRLSLTSPGWPG
jgi:hypothetical protein